MVYSPTYTTVTLVSGALSQLDADLASSDIESKINMAEGTIDAVMKEKGRGTTKGFTYDADVHGIITDCATALAAFYCIHYDISEFATSTKAGLAADMLWARASKLLGFLADKGVTKWLKEVVA